MRTTNLMMAFWMGLQVFLASSAAYSAPKKAKKAQSVPAKEQAVVAPEANAPIKADADDDVVVGSSTRIDFSETSIDGKMKAPDGFFLQGHNANSLSQMVKLRSNFRPELRNSRSAVKSHVK